MRDILYTENLGLNHHFKAGAELGFVDNACPSTVLPNLQRRAGKKGTAR